MPAPAAPPARKPAAGSGTSKVAAAKVKHMANQSISNSKRGVPQGGGGAAVDSLATVAAAKSGAGQGFVPHALGGFPRGQGVGLNRKKRGN